MISYKGIKLKGLKMGIFLLVLAAGQFLFVRSALAADLTCFCNHSLSRITAQNFKDGTEADNKIIGWCHPQVSACNTDTVLPQTGPRYDECAPFSGATAAVDCKDREEEWLTAKTQKIKEVFGGGATTGGTAGPSSGGGALSKIIPECVLSGEMTPESECSNVNIFLTTLLNVAHYLFGIIGALALAMFVYGGFILILSQGSPDKVKQGTGIMAAAVIGLLIAFGAYLLVQFLQEAIGFSEANLK